MTTSIGVSSRYRPASVSRPRHVGRGGASNRVHGGLVRMAARCTVAKLPWRDRVTPGVAVTTADGGIRIDLHVIVEYGLNLAEVGSSIRSRVGYEVERLTKLPVAAVEVHIDDVKETK